MRFLTEGAVMEEYDTHQIGVFEGTRMIDGAGLTWLLRCPGEDSHFNYGYTSIAHLLELWFVIE